VGGGRDDDRTLGFGTALTYTTPATHAHVEVGPDGSVILVAPDGTRTIIDPNDMPTENVEIGDDGSLTYTDPQTGQVIAVAGAYGERSDDAVDPDAGASDDADDTGASGSDKHSRQ
jgi:hypothetical protein